MNFELLYVYSPGHPKEGSHPSASNSRARAANMYGHFLAFRIQRYVRFLYQ